MHFFTMEFGGRGPWEIHRLPGGDSYRITKARIGESSPAESYPFDQANAMRSITWWTLKGESVHPLNERMVEGLLEIHRAVRPQAARDVHVTALLREYGFWHYLDQVREDLIDAVRIGQLRVDLLPPLQFAVPREKEPPSKRDPAPPPSEDTEITYPFSA